MVSLRTKTELLLRSNVSAAAAAVVTSVASDSVQPH